MPVVHLSGASLTQYQETVNAQGEIVITARYQGVDLAQTLICEPPCIIFFNPATLNFYVGHLEEYQPNSQFVEVVTAIT
jgi:hypothetical protein